MTVVTKQEFLRLSELCQDAVKCSSLTAWEEAFMNDLFLRLDEHAESTQLSDKQWTVIDGIERKVYAT